MLFFIRTIYSWTKNNDKIFKYNNRLFVVNIFIALFRICILELRKKNRTIISRSKMFIMLIYSISITLHWLTIHRYLQVSRQKLLQHNSHISNSLMNMNWTKLSINNHSWENYYIQILSYETNSKFLAGTSRWWFDN